MSNSPAPSPSNTDHKQMHVIIPRKAPEAPSTEAAKARQSFRTPQELGVAIPSAVQYVVRTLPEVTREQRMQVLRACEFNMFSFPAALLTCDFLSDSGTSAMTDMQWAALLRGDESYGRNYGYYCLLDAVRDAFERGDGPLNRTDQLLSTSRKPDTLIEFFMMEESGGFVNGGRAQLIRPNFFLTPQGRCAEHLLYSTMASILAARDKARDPSAEPIEYVVPSNGFFDTTEAHAHTNRFKTVNLFAANLWEEFSVDDMWTRNPFKGNIDLERLQQLINTVGAERIPCILLTVTNNTAAGQPVSMENIRETSAIARKFDIPLVVDACRFAENAAFIHEFEPGYSTKSIRAIVKEMMTYFDVCTMSLKKDGLANIGGFLCFRDQGVFHRKFSTPQVDVGVAIKEKQITVFGNDSYGGLSGRDIMAAAVGLHEVLQPAYLRHRIAQTRNFAEQLARRGVPVVLPAGGHAIYLDMNRFLHPDHHTQAYWKRLERQLGPAKEATGPSGGLPKSNSWAEKHHDLMEKLKLKEVEHAKEEADIRDLRGMGFCIELLAEYGIRCCELGPFAFEWDQKTEEQKQGILNLVRLAIPRNAFNEEHINYTVEAISELHAKSKLLPRVRITRGQDLHLRHFQSGLMPVDEQS